MTMFAPAAPKLFADENFVNRAIVRLNFIGANEHAFAERKTIGFHGAFAI